MLQESLLSITRVQETHSQNEANELLEKGWKLINIYTGSFSVDYDDHVNIYVLGKPDEPVNI
ncbi:hypothetical protein HMPREF1982_00890 [Clostridiales bacterium oral taxon 876 str. F0540]|nr:hypothetical protein HMPREF1982_00890 [Clostridiales bacterium oral taxon 876 str. F0540]